MKPLTELTYDELGIASNHPYDCRCDLCKRWWQELGPDGGEEGNYGPFSEDEIVETAHDQSTETRIS